MKNKIIRNIILIYFVVISIVLLVQIVSQNKKIQEPVVEKMSLSENLNDAVVLYNESPVMLVNTRQAIVDSNNSDLMPVIKDGVFYVPLNFFKEAYDAVVSFDSSKNTATVRLNNTAWVLDKTKNEASLIDSYEEKSLVLDHPICFENETAYIALEDFASAFEKNVYFYNENMAVISNSELDIEEDKELLQQLEKNVNNLPCIINSSKLKQLLGKSVYTFPDLGIGIDDLIKSEKTPEQENFVFSMEESCIYAVSENYAYIIDDGKVQIIDTAFSTEEPVTQLFMDSDVNAEKIVINNDRLVVFASSKSDKNEQGYYSVLVYDMSIKSNPQLLNEVQICGRIEDFVFRNEALIFVSEVSAESLEENKEYKPPFYYVDGEYSEISFEDIRYMPKLQNKNYSTVFSLNLYDASVQSYCVLGAGDNLYLDNNGKYFYITAKRSLANVDDTRILAFSLVDDMGYSNKTIVKGYEKDKNLFTFNNHIFTVTKSNGKYVLHILDNSLNAINEVNPIIFNKDTMEFMGERIYFKDKNANLTFVDINDVNNCVQSDIVNIGQDVKLYPYKDNYFVALEGNVLSVLDMNDIENIKNLSSVEVQGEVVDVFVSKGSICVNVSEEKEQATETVTGEETSTQTGVQLKNIYYVYTVNDNFNISLVGNLSHTLEDKPEGELIYGSIKAGNKYITVSDSKILVSDEKLVPLFTLEK